VEPTWLSKVNCMSDPKVQSGCNPTKDAGFYNLQYLAINCDPILENQSNKSHIR